MRMSHLMRPALLLVFVCSIAWGAIVAADEGETAPTVAESRTRIVLLGTGTPRAQPDRSGPAVAIVVDDTAYLFDCGPGVVRRAAAAHQEGIEALSVTNLTRLFITHLHSDHTVGLADLMLTPWVLGRDLPLQVHGPTGTKRMVRHLLKAYKEDIDMRLHGNQPSKERGIGVDVHTVKPGIVYRDPLITVTAFPVHHYTWKHAFGYRIETVDRTIVISGDTRPVESVVQACDGCDVLIHEVYAKKGFDTRAPEWQTYHRGAHTSGIELGELAARAKPGLLILYHQLLWGATPEELVDEIKQSFKGEIAYGNDLDVY